MSNEKIPLRKDVPQEFKWDLTKLYKTESDWEKDLSKIPEFTKKFVEFKGRLSESSDTLLKALKAADRTDIIPTDFDDFRIRPAVHRIVPDGAAELHGLAGLLCLEEGIDVHGYIRFREVFPMQASARPEVRSSSIAWERSRA